MSNERKILMKEMTYVAVPKMQPFISMEPAPTIAAKHRIDETPIITFSFFRGDEVIKLFEKGRPYETEDHIYYFDVGTSILTIKDRRLGDVIRSVWVDTEELMKTLKHFHDWESGYELCRLKRKFEEES